MKNQLLKFALEDTRNGDIAGGCYGRGKSSARFLFLERGLNVGKGDPKKTGCPERKEEF
jgi:hypothetical protein